MPSRPDDEHEDRKRRWKFGQNFLIDEGVIRDIVEDAGAAPGDWILEIGPGQGAITRRLAPRCAKLTAIEVDPKWVDHLLKHPEWGNIEVIHADATRVDVEQILDQHAPTPASKPLVVGNLPYNRAAPILFRFLPHIARFRFIQIMVQYEVAKRMCAKPHGRDFGFLSVFVQNLATPEFLRKIGPESFRPRPKVLSATVRLTALPAPTATHPLFLRFVELAFSQKRKKMANSLLPFYPKDKVEAALAAANVRVDARAEDLSVPEFAQVFETLGPPPGVPPRPGALPADLPLDETDDAAEE